MMIFRITCVYDFGPPFCWCQIAYLNALRFGLKRIFFGGFFIRGHAYTMDTISVAVNFW